MCSSFCRGTGSVFVRTLSLRVELVGVVFSQFFEGRTICRRHDQLSPFAAVMTPHQNFLFFP
jgi:hypothetical protein